MKEAKNKSLESIDALLHHLGIALVDADNIEETGLLLAHVGNVGSKEESEDRHRHGNQHAQATEGALRIEMLDSEAWLLVKGFNLHDHNKETILFTIDPYYGNLKKIP